MKKHLWALCLLFASVWVVSAYAGAVRVLRVNSEEEEHTTSIAATDLNSKVIWNARQQSLLLLAERSANAQVTVFDIQGVRLARLNFAVISGFNEVPLSKMNLANGRFVLHVDLDGKRSLKVISIGSVK